MRTLRLSLAGTVILVLLVGLGGAALAQSEGEDSAIVTIENVESLVKGEADGSMWNVAELETSDPRLSGTWTENWSCRDGLPVSVCVATVRVENDGGTWLGRLEGFGHAGGLFDWTVLEGQGGYEGLTALRLMGETGPGLLETVEHMVITDFEMPAQPEPKLPPAE